MLRHGLETWQGCLTVEVRLAGLAVETADSLASFEVALQIRHREKRADLACPPGCHADDFPLPSVLPALAHEQGVRAPCSQSDCRWEHS